ncbi:MAG TPA: allophanate hydrolase [Advenella kashmirensis]|uniref:Allophanate hydrolase n=1 Tax=Advenella kashmirensis TaxID=310575 RepID=A0A356LKQ9_9BURK|nr:allophanate hydrolase [Advenella kashmirensis]
MSSHPANSTAPWTFTSEGDHCLIIRFGDRIDPAINARARQAAELIHNAGLPYISDLVPTFTTLGVYLHPFYAEPPVHKTLIDTLTAVLAPLARLQDAAADSVTEATRLIRIPVCYDPELGIDLTQIARHCELTVDEVIQLHTTAPVRVFMLGFAPGMGYMGLSDSRLAIGRRSTPRNRLPAGSVAIANRQTVIYPNESPGGWNIVGATPLRLFDPSTPPYALYAPGDQVQFEAIDREQYEQIKAQQHATD